MTFKTNEEAFNSGINYFPQLAQSAPDCPLMDESIVLIGPIVVMNCPEKVIVYCFLTC